LLLQEQDKSVDINKDGPVSSTEPEPGTSADNTSSSKKDKSEFIKLRVVGQVGSLVPLFDCLSGREQFENKSVQHINNFTVFIITFMFTGTCKIHSGGNVINSVQF